MMRDALCSAKLLVVDRPLNPCLEVTEFISNWIRRHNYYPTFEFNNIHGSLGFKLIMNLLKREILFRNMNVANSTYLHAFHERLQSAGIVERGQSLALNYISSINALPILQHQPRERGKYLTSF